MQNHTLLFARLAGLACLVCMACATSPEATVIGSSVSGKLLSDTKNLVMVVDAARAPDCGEAREITAELVEPDKEGLVAERWKVERCGSVKFYRIHYRPTSSTAGMDFSVQEEKGPRLDQRRKQRFDPPAP